MNIHKNAKTTPKMRALIVARRQAGEAPVQIASALGVSVVTVRKWIARHAAEGDPGLVDRSSRPRQLQSRTTGDQRAKVEALRRQRQPFWKIAASVGLSRATVARIGKACGLEYPSWSSRFSHPQPICFDECVSKFDELSHQSGYCDFGGFSRFSEGLVFGLEVWVEAHGDDGGHVERASQVVSSALNEGVAFPLPGLARHGRKACEACHLFAVQGADLRAFGQHGGGGHGAEAGNGTDDFEGAGKRFFGVDAAPDFEVDVTQLPFDQGQAGLALLDHKGDHLGLDAVQKAGLVLDHCLACDL